MSKVRDQYERWVYPFPAQDLDEEEKEGTFDLSDPSRFRRKLWPRPVEPENLKILVAGCGTMQAARLAYRNPGCTVTGVDISQSSLDHQHYLKEKHALGNLRLACLSILDIETLGEQFDLIVSTGVLHHLPDPDAGLRQLKKVLLPHGVMSLMVYGWYRRFGVYMMQEAFRLVGVEQTKEGVDVVRETIAALPAWHHVKAFVRSTPDVDFDAGIVDLFLHPQDRAYSVPQVLSFATENGLCFQDWLDGHGYALTAQIRSSLGIYPLAARLPLDKQWHLAELLGQHLGTHSFLLCHPERDPQEYRIDFADKAGTAWLNYVPQLRFPIDWLFADDKWTRLVLGSINPPSGSPATMRRHTHPFTLSERETPLFNRIDGQATIAQIIQACSATPQQLEQNRDVAFELFARLRAWDHLLFQI
jgi:SAM-dependent methyltransferase